MKKTALASAISLAMMSGSVLAVPCNVLGPTGQPIAPFDQEAGVTCTTTTVAGQFILDKTSIKAGETVNLAILGLNTAGEVDRFGEDGGSILMAVVSTTQGLIPATGSVIPLQGSPNSGQTPEDVIAKGSFVNRQGNPSNNPDDMKTLRVIQLENGNGEINIYYPPNVSPTVGGRVTVKLQERESTANGGIRVNTIAEVTKNITIAPPASNPFALDVVEFLDGFNDGAGVIDSDSSDGIHGMMTAGSTGAGAEVTIKALNERAGGTVNLTLTPVKGGGAPLTTSGSMVNGSSTISLPSITKAGDYYVKAEMSFTEGDVAKTVSSVDLETVDKITVIPTGVPKALSLSFNKERITQVGEGAMVKVEYLDEYGNVTTSRAGSSYTASVKEANGNTATLTAVLDAFGNHDALVLGDAAGEISIATGTLSMSATVGTGLSPSSVVSLDVVDKVFAVSVLPGFLPGVGLISNNQVEAIHIDKDPGSTNPVTITNTNTDETSEALRDPTTGNVRALFRKIGDGPYLVSDRNGLYAQILVDGASIVPGAPISLEVRNAHNEVVNTVLTTLLDDNSGLETDIPEKAIRLFDQYANPVTGAPAGKFTLTSAVDGATVTYPVGASSATPTGTERVVVNYPISAAGSGDVPLTVQLTAPGFTDATEIQTTLPEVITFESIKAYVEQSTIPVNSKVALTVELLDQNGDAVEGDNAIRLVVNGLEGDTITAPVIREVMADGSRGELLVPNKIMNFTNGKKVFEVNAGQTTGQFTLSFVDPTASVELPAVTTFIVTQVLENECSSTNLVGCMDEVTCNAVGGGYSGETCTSLPALGVVGMDNTGAEVVATGASVKGGFSVNGNAFANPATATDTGASVKIVASLEPADADVGAEADTIVMFTSYFLDGALDLTRIFVLGDGGASVTPWDFTIEGIPAYSTQTLAEYNVLNLLDTGSTGFGIEGNLLILVAYRLTNGTVVYSENLLSLKIDDPRIEN